MKYVSTHSQKAMDAMLLFQQKMKYMSNDNVNKNDIYLTQQNQLQKKHDKQTNNKQYNKSKQYCLPICYAHHAPTPNPFLRSSLFGLIQRGRRSVFTPDNPQIVTTVDGCEIKRIGQQTDQNDLDVFQALIYLCCKKMKDFSILENKNPNVQIETTAYELLQIIGIKDNGRERRLLYERITRLANTTIVINFICNGQKYDYNGNMIFDVLQIQTDNKKSWERRLIVNINKRIVRLFVKDSYTIIDLKIKHYLGKNNLAKWLYQFYSTHKKPYPYKIETIQRLCGKNWTNKKYFTRDLKDAAELINDVYKQVYKTDDNILVFCITNGLVCVSRDSGKGSDPGRIPQKN